METNEKQEILEAIQRGNQKLSDKIDDVEQNLTDQIGLMADEVHGIDIRLKHVESQQVTKEYLDRKLADLHIKVVDHVKERVSCWKERSILKTAN